MKQLYFLARSHKDSAHPHDISMLDLIGRSPSILTLKRLQEKGWVYHANGLFWGLTQKGFLISESYFKD